MSTPFSSRVQRDSLPIEEAAARVAKQFVGALSVPKIRPLGKGLINDTFLVESGQRRLVLQRINRQVFPDPDAIMTNLQVLNRHAHPSAGSHEGTGWRLPELVPTLAGTPAYYDEQGECWRSLTFIDHALPLPAIRHHHQAEQVGQALGRFHRLGASIPAESLRETLIDFHVTSRYLERFEEVLHQANPPSGLKRLANDELSLALNFVARRKSGLDRLDQAREQGVLQLQVIHGDPKLDNILFDRDERHAISLIDLDTVMPGLIHHDLGDCLRSCCNRERMGRGEGFDLEICRAILTGHRLEAGACLTRVDIGYLYDAIRLLPIELGIRFLTDHLQGDRYFKTGYPGQNLARALGQFRLARSIEAQEGEIRQIIRELYP